jgi:predicted nucleotidyltransferase
VDRRGFYLPPADLEWSLAGVLEQLETDNEEAYWEIEKFIRLALKANPNVLECLYSPLVETCTPLGQELIGMRSAFLSRCVHRTYNAYVLSQFKNLEQDLRSHGQSQPIHFSRPP